MCKHLGIGPREAEQCTLDEVYYILKDETPETVTFKDMGEFKAWQQKHK